mgnify:CR=1 FL=1
MGGSGSTTTNTEDEVYNARMATIAESQQGMAEENYQYYKEYYQPYEKEQIAANRELLPYQKGMQKEALIAGANALDPNMAMDAASADVAQSFAGAQDSMTRNLAKRGVRMDSGQAMQMQKDTALSRAKAVGGARTGARQDIGNKALAYIGGQG